MKKRILVVSQHFWPETFRINDICDGFKEHGYTVEVLCGIPNYPAGQFFDGYGIRTNRRQKRDGIKIRRCFEIKRGSNSNIRIFLNYTSFPFFSLFSLPYLLRQNYDKIFLYQTSPVLMSMTGIILGRLKKIETIMYVLDLWPENLYSVLKIRSKLLRKFITWVSDRHYIKTDKLISNSQRLKPLLIARTGKEENKVTYIPQFCEKVFENTDIDEELEARFLTTFNLVFTGNISPAQSFKTVISAAKILKGKGYRDIAWIIIGDGMSSEWLKKEIIKEGLADRFTFIGRVPIHEIPRYTHIANGLFACLAKSELLDCTLPAKVFSYYAAGRPMILAMDGEIQQIVRESGAGYAVDSEDSEGFAEAVIKLYETSWEKRDQMGNDAKDYYFKHFERNKNMEKLIAFIES